MEQAESLAIPFASVVEVQVKPDMSWADAFLSFADPHPEKQLEKLQRHIYEIQGELNRKLTTKKLPRLHLKLDASISAADKIEQLLKADEQRNS